MCCSDFLRHSVEEIHSVGTINNVETSYFTQLKICYLITTFRCPSDLLITSGLFTARWSTWPGNHLVPCVAELVGSEGQGQGWREDRIDLSCPLQELLQLICWRDRHEVRSEDQGTQERSGLFHSWYTDPNLQGKGEQCNSQVSHHIPCRGRVPCHRLGQGKSGRQRGTATDQMDKRSGRHRCAWIGMQDPTNSATHGTRISRSRAPSSCEQSRRDKDDVRRT